MEVLIKAIPLLHRSILYHRLTLQNCFLELYFYCLLKRPICVYILPTLLKKCAVVVYQNFFQHFFMILHSVYVKKLFWHVELLCHILLKYFSRIIDCIIGYAYFNMSKICTMLHFQQTSNIDCLTSKQPISLTVIQILINEQLSVRLKVFKEEK